MPFPLTDLKRSYGRSGARGGVPDVRPYLLTGATLKGHAARVQAIVQWYEGHLGRRRAAMDDDEVARIAGDYRLGRCLASCLLRYYRFAADDVEAHVLAQPDGRRRWSALLARGVDSAPALRLHLFDHVQGACGGFVPPERRPAAIASVAEDLGLAAGVVEELLWLDSEEHHRLVRLDAVDAAPGVAEVVALYNRRAVETLLVRALSADLVLPHPTGETVRRFYFLVKRHGLLCELALAQPGRGVEAGVIVHLFGPLQVFGPRTRHGDRFAGLVLQVLRTFPGVVGSARVLLNEREYVVRLDEETVASLAAAPEDLDEQAEGETESAEAATAVVARREPVEQFDSEVEARLFATLDGMERRGDLGSWHAEREAEPVIHEGVVFVPDFLLTRPAAGGRAPDRVYVEVIGFWTPAYRQRKREKLQRLAGAIPLILLVQEQLAGDFADLPFPVLSYKQRPSAEELFRLLKREYGRAGVSAEELAAGLAAHLAAVEPAQQVVPEADLRAALGVAPAEGRAILPDGWEWVPGLGTCRTGWLHALHRSVAAAIRACSEEDPNGVPDGVPLERIRAAVAAAPLPDAPLAAESLESLLSRLGYRVLWQSLFDATVAVETAAPTSASP
jgi:predicted nuclease of restriction endonuclease-like RecB superfamily